MTAWQEEVWETEIEKTEADEKGQVNERIEISEKRKRKSRKWPLRYVEPSKNVQGQWLE